MYNVLGQKGATGATGSKGQAGTSSGATFARHSQTNQIPPTPSGYTSLWTGYSFMYGLGGDGITFQVDLGGPNSCLKTFRAIPFTECDSPTRCDYFTGSDYAYWLTALSVDSGTLTNPAAAVSRCRVVTSTKAVMVAHSMSSSIPSAPISGWVSLWSGTARLRESVCEAREFTCSRRVLFPWIWRWWWRPLHSRSFVGWLVYACFPQTGCN